VNGNPLHVDGREDQMRWDDEVKLDLKVMKIYHTKKLAESGY
jgi:hypothetical protein